MCNIPGRFTVQHVAASLTSTEYNFVQGSMLLLAAQGKHLLQLQTALVFSSFKWVLQGSGDSCLLPALICPLQLQAHVLKHLLVRLLNVIRYCCHIDWH